jgi:hypothetical protein
MTVFGCANVIFDEYVLITNPFKAPASVKYAGLQIMNMFAFLQAVLNQDLSQSFSHKTYQMPIDENSWKSEEDFESRFIFLVKAQYEALKKEGKIE